jgi:hypothetical protein
MINPDPAARPVPSTSVVESCVRKARQAFRGASRWATPVMLLAFPVVFWEFTWPVFTGAIDHSVAGVLSGIIGSVVFCGGLWAVWVGSAWCAGYLRERLSDSRSNSEQRNAADSQ